MKVTENRLEPKLQQGERGGGAEAGGGVEETGGGEEGGRVGEVWCQGEESRPPALLSCSVQLSLTPSIANRV